MILTLRSDLWVLSAFFAMTVLLLVVTCGWPCILSLIPAFFAMTVYLHPYILPLCEFLLFTWAHWCTALPADVRISVFFFLFFFYGHCLKSYSIKCGMFEKMKTRTFRWVILLWLLAFESRTFFKYSTTVLVHRHKHAGWPTTSCLVQHRQRRKA